MKILSSATGGATVRELCESHAGSENTFYTWKRKTSGLQSEDSHKLKALPSEHQALKQILADQALLIDARLKVLRKSGRPLRPKVGSPLPDFRSCIQTQGMSVRGNHKARSRFAFDRQRG